MGGPSVESQQGEFLSRGAGKVEAPEMKSYAKGAGISASRIVHEETGFGQRCGECKTIQEGPRYSDCDCGNPLDQLTNCYYRVIYYRTSWWYRFWWNMQGTAKRVIKKYEVKDVKIVVNK